MIQIFHEIQRKTEVWENLFKQRLNAISKSLQETLDQTNLYLNCESDSLLNNVEKCISSTEEESTESSNAIPVQFEANLHIEKNNDSLEIKNSFIQVKFSIIQERLAKINALNFTLTSFMFSEDDLVTIGCLRKKN